MKVTLHKNKDQHYAVRFNGKETTLTVIFDGWAKEWDLWEADEQLMMTCKARGRLVERLQVLATLVEGYA